MINVEEQYSIESIFDQYNTAWLERDISMLKSLMHEDVIILWQDHATEIRGRKDCLQKIRSYWNNGKTLSFKVTSKSFHFLDFAANIVFSYQVEYHRAGFCIIDKGTELWNLVKENQQWLLSYRALLSTQRLKNEKL